MEALKEERLHLALNTAQFEESIEFYKVLFGMEPTKLKDGYAKFEVARPPVNFTLNRSARPSAEISPLNHLGIQVPVSETVFEQEKRLKALGLPTELENETHCCYAVQDKVWVNDPDGNAWEIFAVLGESEERDASHTCCAD